MFQSPPTGVWLHLFGVIGQWSPSHCLPGVYFYTKGWGFLTALKRCKVKLFGKRPFSKRSAVAGRGWVLRATVCRGLLVLWGFKFKLPVGHDGHAGWLVVGFLGLAGVTSTLRPGRGGVRFTVTGPASDGPLTLVERGVTAL